MLMVLITILFRVRCNLQVVKVNTEVIRIY